MRIVVDTYEFPDGGSAFEAKLMRQLAHALAEHGRSRIAESDNPKTGFASSRERADHRSAGRRYVALASELRWAASDGWSP